MKKTIIILTVIIFAASLFGCTKNLSSEKTHSSSNNAGSAITLDNSYSYKDETTNSTFTLSESGSVDFKLTSKTKSGSVHFKVMDEDGNVLIEEFGEKFSVNETLSLDGGTYTIAFIFAEAEEGSVDMKISASNHIEYDDGKENDKESKDD